MDDYRAVHRYARTALPIAVEMEELFGDADHFITHFGMSGKKNIWNTAVFFDGRFELTMQVDIVIDYGNNTFSLTGSPKFFLTEVREIYQLPDGRFGAKLGANHLFTEEDWKKLYATSGDLSAIAVTPETDDPLPRFDEYVMGWRRPRIPISLRDKKTEGKRLDATRRKGQVQATLTE
jgi:hypothetical protein